MWEMLHIPIPSWKFTKNINPLMELKTATFENSKTIFLKYNQTLLSPLPFVSHIGCFKIPWNILREMFHKMKKMI